MEDTTQTDLETSVPVTDPSEQDPVEAELETIKQKPQKTRLEKLEFTKKRVEEQLAQERQAQGLEVEDEDRPVTVKELKDFFKQEELNTAVVLAQAIEDDKERELVLHHLQNTIKPSGDAQQDLRTARLIVNGVKNSQKVEEIARTKAPRTVASAPSAPARETKEEELTSEEVAMMKGFGLTKDQVLASRQ